jgi:hypothetical protein
MVDLLSPLRQITMKTSSDLNRTSPKSSSVVLWAGNEEKCYSPGLETYSNTNRTLILYAIGFMTVTIKQFQSGLWNLIQRNIRGRVQAISWLCDITSFLCYPSQYVKHVLGAQNEGRRVLTVCGKVRTLPKFSTTHLAWLSANRDIAWITRPSEHQTFCIKRDNVVLGYVLLCLNVCKCYKTFLTP